MASGSFSTSVAGGHYTLRADWSGTGAASNNTTPVNVKLYLVNDWNLDIGSRSGYIKINGTQTNITSSSISSKGTHLLGQATTNVVHNADGSKSSGIGDGDNRLLVARCIDSEARNRGSSRRVSHRVIDVQDFHDDGADAR